LTISHGGKRDLLVWQKFSLYYFTDERRFKFWPKLLLPKLLEII
jgi:hypothetical protein